jgi:hypothetical protein
MTRWSYFAFAILVHVTCAQVRDTTEEVKPDIRSFGWSIVLVVAIYVLATKVHAWRIHCAMDDAFGKDTIAGGVAATWLHHTQWNGHIQASRLVADGTWTIKSWRMTLEAVAWNTLSGRLVGEGNDIDGDFTIDGRYSATTNRVVFLLKRRDCCFREHTLFEGHVGLEVASETRYYVMSGTWKRWCTGRTRASLCDTESGPFELKSTLV